ncbi:gamma-glutamyl phosphate reductase [Legionella lansingensis]|uniref:Gamma-glutamyl phosphate reductase n=1 Tax=Legionella lansingensis TaxID=45067 RepID=A0A0W0VIZ8_9GAMM|nr:glutamate-5-semialdehyde dehydrogenase [Legionella lansingensis]KTD20099.1 gamma-glutamyl phosphate reductase [Legionella lansingensis]SNV51120.1 gamma-glutamyl phosphate reductase [Legionella lansingensis]
MLEEVIDQLKIVKKASHSLMLIDEEMRNQVLLTLAKQLRKSVSKIIDENKKDLALMNKEDPKYDRLLLSAERIYSIAADVELVASLPHPRATILDEKKLPNGLKIQKVTVPLGVVAVIYESRPNVTIDAFALCFKTGNACVLKGGKEAYHSNQCLVSLIKQALHHHDITENVVYLLPLEREALNTLLKANHFVDVCIPRGSQSLINFVRKNARIPFIETGAGIVHTYFDSSADVEKGRLIIDNAKTRRVSVCNALDTLIIHEKRLPDLHLLVEPLANKNVEIFADDHSYKALESFYPKKLLHQASAKDFGQEFLSYKMSIKTVASVEGAVNHIMEYSSGHSEAIIAEDQAAIRYFLDHIDAAAVYVNASTAFTDGGQFGMGAEIGISTQKLHARGPMSLDALTSYKWIVLGDGHIRT